MNQLQVAAAVPLQVGAKDRAALTEDANRNQNQNLDPQGGGGGGLFGESVK